MRYQPAYNYPGTRKIAQQPVQEAPRWRFQKPQLDMEEQSKLVKAVRFVLMMVGCILLVLGAGHFYTADQAQGWQKQSVTITRADVVRTQVDNAKPIFTALVEYQYQINGVTHTSSRLAVRPIRSTNPAEVKRHLAPYKVGRNVVAMVDPGHMAGSFLTTSPSYYLSYLVLPGLLLVTLSLAIGQTLSLLALRRRREQWRFGDYPTRGATAAILA